VHVPRKNHLAVLEAAERLWLSGHAFELKLIGGFSRAASYEFEGYVRDLKASGWPVHIQRRASEDELWAAYRGASFTVYPSLLEGFGLPVAESLACGTPVITTRHGCLAELAEGGGAVLVDPRDVDELTEQMRRLLEDEDALAELRRQASARDFGTWDAYARDVWEYLVGEPY
jgi:glycosyltransferase involved in cell wall biosynthesis